MIIIHAAQLDGNLTVWAEDSDPPTPSGQLSEGHHPGAASALRLTEAIGITSQTSTAIPTEATVWLPSQGNMPIPAEPLAGPPPKSRAKPRIKPWRVPAITLPGGPAIEFLHSCEHNRVLAPGVFISPEVTYWRQAMFYATNLTTRQQFLPDATQTQDQTKAVWTPLYIGDDAFRIAEMAKAMPSSARALTSLEQRQPPTMPPSVILKEFITNIVNHIIRQGQQSVSTECNSAHEAWLQALTTEDGVIHAETAQLQQLRRQISDWRHPISVAANSPYRLCLRLEEPPEPEDDDPPSVLRQPDWNLRYLLQPHDDHSLLLPVDNLKDRKEQDFNPGEFLLTSLAQASAICPPVADSLRRKNPTNARLDAEQAYHFLSQQAAPLEQAGFGVLLPAWWTRQGTKTKPYVRVQTATPAMQGGGHITMDSLIDLNIEVAMGDQVIEPEELAALAELKVPLVRFRGQWVEINPSEIQAAADFWRDRNQTTLREVIRIGLGADPNAENDKVALDTSGWIDNLLESLQEKRKIDLLDTPAAFAGELRPYQQLGYSWLDFLRSWSLGACLADDMGLGKTIQTLVAILKDHEAGNDKPNLLVCPTSVINNWQREARKFTPTLATLLHHGSQRAHGEQFAQQAASHQLVITSYGSMWRDRETLAAIDWRSVTLDEAQNIKNPTTRQARAARSLPADYRIALTGTPVENHVGDLWSIMQFLNPDLLGSQAEFKRRYFTPIQIHGDKETAAQLQKATSPFILRRLKTDPTIIDDLPDKHETKQYCNLTKEQATLYEAVLRDVTSRLDDVEGMDRRGAIFDTLIKLKQVCNHPRQLLGDNSPIPGRSGKLARLEELLEEIIPADDRVLIFSQFAEMGMILQQHVQETYGIETPLLHGGVSRQKRDQMVERFQNDPHGPQVFILSLKAGGSGLNLPRANHVIHYDRWWNPAAENQATDRAFRIGQTKDVHVHKMICAGTLEDRIDLMIENKRATAEQVVGVTSESWLTELSNDELYDILALNATPEA